MLEDTHDMTQDAAEHVHAKVRYKDMSHCSIRGMVSELEQMQAIGSS